MKYIEVKNKAKKGYKNKITHRIQNHKTPVRFEPGAPCGQLWQMRIHCLEFIILTFIEISFIYFLKYFIARTFFIKNIFRKSSISILFRLKNAVKMYKTLLYRHDRIIIDTYQIEFIFHKDLNFRISDSMSDFIFIPINEFSVKKYIFCFL